MLALKVLKVFSIKDYLRENREDAFSFLISCLVFEIFIFWNIQIKANLWCHLLTHPKWDLRNKEYLTKKPVKFIQFFYEYASTLPYYTRVKFELILLVSFNNISCFVKCNLYIVCVSRWHHKLFAYFDTVKIWRTRQVIEKLKTLCRSILIIEIIDLECVLGNLAGTDKMICPYKSAMMDWSEERRSVCGGAVYKLASATQGAKYKIIILQQTTNFFSSWQIITTCM